MISRYISEDISILMQKGMDNLYKKKKSSSYDQMFYLMKTIIQSLNGGFNILRKTTIQHCRSLVNEEVLTKSDRNLLDIYLWRIDIITNWEWYVRKSTRCRFLYWNRALFPLFF